MSFDHEHQGYAAFCFKPSSTTFGYSSEASVEDTPKIPKGSQLPTSQFVSDESTVVRGGKSELPPIGTTFSAAVGLDKYDAGKWIPHGQMRVSTASGIRAYGGTVILKPEVSRSGVLNDHYVEVVEGRSGAFGEIEPNPVPKLDRIG